MTLTELIPSIQKLNRRSEKIQLLQIIVNELDQEEQNQNLTHQEKYPIYSPLNAFEAADTLLQVLEKNKYYLEEKAKKGSWNKFKQALDKVSDQEPEDYDKL